MTINFEIDDQKWEIQDLTIRNYYDIKLDLMIDGMEGKFAVVSRLSGCPVETLKELTVQSWNDIWIALEVMIANGFKDDMTIMNQFIFEGKEYGLVDFEAMTIGEFIDLDMIVSAENVDSRLHEILAVLYRPIIRKKWNKNIVEKYNTESYNFRREIFLDLPVRYAKTAIGFFLLIAQVSIKAMPTSSTLTMQEIQLEMENVLKEMSGKNGMPSSLSLLEKVLLRSVDLQNSESKKPLTSLPTNKTWFAKRMSRLEKWFNKYKSLK